jgi:O-antigen ligase
MTRGGISSDRTPISRQAPLNKPSGPAFRLQHVQWNVLYAAFLLYCFAIITYFVNAASVAIGAALLGLFLMGKPLRLPPHLALFGLYVAWAAIGIHSSALPAVTQERVVDYLKLWLIALVAVNALRTRAQIQGFLIFVVGCYALFPARGAIVNYIVGYAPFGRAVWSYIYGNANDLAALMLLGMGTATALFVSEAHKTIRMAAVAASMLFGGIILMTQSRGALVALAVFALLTVQGQKRKLRAFLLLAVCGSVVIAVAPSGIWERAKGMVFLSNLENLAQVDEEGSAEQRYEIWKVAVAIIADHPVRGTGLGTYPEMHFIYALAGESVTARGTRDTHSTYLNVAAETGAVGLAIFVLMIGAVFVGVERGRRRLRHVSGAEAGRLWFLQLGLGAYLVAGIWGSFPHLAFLHVFMAATVAAAITTGTPPLKQTVRRRGVAVRGGLSNTSNYPT